MAQSRKGVLSLLVMQPTPFCNINCAYCYLPARGDRSRMSNDVIEAACRRVTAAGVLGDELTILWHAGEPLVLPSSWYENAFALVARLIPATTKVTHHFQTNGTLIDESWCAFLAHPDIRLGLSIDGPPALHDRFRVTRSGSGTHAKAMAAVRLLNARAIPYSVISVLTRNSLFYPDEFYAFYVDSGIRDVSFNFEEIEGINRQSSLSDLRGIALCRRFLERFLELVSDGDEIRSVREFDQAFGMLLRSDPVEGRCSQQGDPFRIISVAHDGDFSTFSPELLGNTHPRWGDFTLGNVLRDSIDDAAMSAKYIAMFQEITAGRERCRRTCSYYGLCGGGAPVNKLYETDTFDTAETMFCRYTIQVPTDVALAALETRNAANPPSADSGHLAGPS